MMQFGLDGKIVLVTGGTSGIGRAIVEAFLAQNAQVVFFGTSQEKADEVIHKAPNGKPVFFKVNVASKSEVDAAVKQVLEKFGRVDVLVNCAGITRDNLLMKMSEQEWDDVLDINLKSCFNLCQTLSRPMLKAKKGKIINISSVIGLIGNPGQANYAASKAGMIGFTKALAREYAGRVEVNSVAPGYIETKMTDELSSSQKDAILEKIPMGRIGRPEDVAGVVLFLASSLSDYMTGQVLTVDGGMVI